MKIKEKVRKKGRDLSIPTSEKGASIYKRKKKKKVGQE